MSGRAYQVDISGDCPHIESITVLWLGPGDREMRVLPPRHKEQRSAISPKTRWIQLRSIAAA